MGPEGILEECARIYGHGVLMPRVTIAPKG
jgi:hypothetical protein